MTPDRSYEFLNMLFGMINSAATLKRAMKKLLHGLENVEFYWGDILVHLYVGRHIKALREMFRRLLAAGMTIRPTKCLFAWSRHCRFSWSSFGGRVNWSSRRQHG